MDKEREITLFTSARTELDNKNARVKRHFHCLVVSIDKYRPSSGKYISLHCKMQLKLPESDAEMDDEVESIIAEHAGKQERLRNHRLPLTCICIDSKNQHAFTGSKDGSIIKWCLESRKILHKLHPIKKKLADSNEQLKKRRHTNGINCLAISSDDKFLASGGAGDPSIRIWSPKDLTWLHTFSLHRKEITALAFRRGHHTLYSGSADRSVMIWTLEEDDNRSFVEALYGHESPITSMDTLYKERALTSGGRDQTIRIWKIVEQAQTVFQSRHESVDVARYIDDKTFVTGGEDGSITVWTTMKRSHLCSVSKAHGYGKGSRTANGDSPFSKNLSFWIASLAVFPFKQPKRIIKESGSRKRRRLDNDREGVTNNDDDDDDDGSSNDGSDSDGEPAGGDEVGTLTAPSDCLALIASGSCDSQLHLWKLTKSKGNHELTLCQTIECPGFINDLRFTSDGSKVVAACGQEHRFGRWWKLKGTKNCLRIFDVNKMIS